MPRYNKKIEETISLKEFESLIEKCRDLLEQSLITILYWTGLRVAEICGDGERKYKIFSKEGHRLSRIGELPWNWDEFPELYVEVVRPKIQGILGKDIELIESELRIKAEALKRGERTKALILDLKLSNVNLIVKQWKGTSPENKVWNISTWKAWNIVKKASDGKLYPHFFRLNRASRTVEDPQTTILELKQWFGWKSTATLAKYLEKSGRGIRKVSDSMKRRGV